MAGVGCRISSAVLFRLILGEHSACGISHPAIEFLFLRRNTEKLLGEFFKAAKAKVFRLTHPRLRIDLRISERHHKLHIVPVEAVISLLQCHFVGMRIAEMIEPRSVVKGIRLDNEYISLPVTDRVSQHSPIGIFRELASIGPDLSMDVVPVEQLKHTAGNSNEFEVP